jgi:hypothetical protein
MARQTLGANNLIATYPDMAAARAAIRALELAGVEAANISVLGRGAAEADAATAVDTPRSDAGVAGDIAKTGAAGAAAGATAGGLAGFLAGAAAFAIPGIGPVIGVGIWATTATGALFGGVLGGYIGGMSKINMSEGWDLTYQEELRAGKVLVAVHADDQKELDRAASALRSTSPAAINQFDASGRHIATSAERL